MSEAVLALPSKGRLKDDCMALLARAGFAVSPPGERGYEASIPALPGLRVLLTPASEIAERMARGDFDAGITGEDVMRERLGWLEGADRTEGVQQLGPGGPVRFSRLGFGPARLVVAAPMSWLDCQTMDDLREISVEIRRTQRRPLRVATKYIRLTRAFFARHLIVDYRIVLSTGATEAAPASGLADVIVDITTSGATLRDNFLSVLEDGLIFASEACLFLRNAEAITAQSAVLATLAKAVSAAAANVSGNAQAKAGMNP